MEGQLPVKFNVSLKAVGRDRGCGLAQYLGTCPAVQTPVWGTIDRRNFLFFI